MLEISKLCAGYGGSQVLFDVDLSIGAGECVTLLGRNGMGKTTLIRCLAGLLRPSRGEIRLSGIPLHDLPTYRVARSGIGLVPEGRQVFPNLTVRENLCATAANRASSPRAWTLKAVIDLLPGLSRRFDTAARLLSGGEQQMVAIGRALMTNPKLLVLDEATEGLAPLVRRDIWECLSRVKAAGQAILMTDKNVEALAKVADRHLVVERGRVVASCDSQTLRDDPSLRSRYLGV